MRFFTQLEQENVQLLMHYMPLKANQCQVDVNQNCCHIFY